MHDDFISVMRAMSDRYAGYDEGAVSRSISERDHMFERGSPEAEQHYFSVGRAAIDVIARAMVCAGKPDAHLILDYACGAGRVARHLRALFPSSEMYVADVTSPDETFAAELVSAKVLNGPRDFSVVPAERFDLIWSGSLLTHLPEAAFKDALLWFALALNADGLLVATTLGRRREAAGRHGMPHDRWHEMLGGYATTGFGFTPDRRFDAAIGHTMCQPSWIAKVIESLPMVRLVSFVEGGWVDAQDVLVLQRRSAVTP